MRDDKPNFGLTFSMRKYKMRIVFVLLCLWAALGAATLKKGVKGGAYESYYCLPLDTKSELFSEKYRKTWGEYDHLAIRFVELPGNSIAFYHAVSEVLGQNTTWQREGFFLVFDAKEPIESIEHRLGKSKGCFVKAGLMNFLGVDIPLLA